MQNNIEKTVPNIYKYIYELESILTISEVK